jgi:protein-L-isoaspartate O-methyltransferase
VTAALGLTGVEEVFEAGTGYGCQTAMLARLAMSTQTGPTVTEVCGPVCAGAEASLAGSGGSSPGDAGGVAVDLGQEVFDSAGGGDSRS